MTPVEVVALHGCSRPEDGRACPVCLKSAEEHVRAVREAGLVVSLPVAGAAATPAEPIEAALHEHFPLRLTRSAIEDAQRGWTVRLSGAQRQDVARIVLEALAGAGLVVVPTELLDALTDSDECWFDHHGGCQAHGFLSLESGERCPHAEAREILAALPERNETP